MAKTEDDFIATARKRFEAAQTEEKTIRDEAAKDLRFVAGEQWDEKVKADRIKTGRPVLTFNRQHTFVQQVANEARQMRGEIKFVPAEDSDKDTADVLEGLARHVQYNSAARVAYETAVDNSAGGSFGYYRFLPEYCDDKSFDQEIKVVPVQDPFSVYGVLMPAIFGTEPSFAFVETRLTKEEYERDYPDDPISDWEWATKNSGGWVDDEGVRIAEYWQVEYERKELKEGEKSRTILVPSVTFCKINGVGKLSGTDATWAGKRIPIFPVLGKCIIVDGKPRLFSVVRFQRDPQQLINFYKTRIAETLGTAPIQPYMVAKGSIAPEDRPMWARLNTQPAPFLEYLPQSDINGQPVERPQRQVFEPPIGSLSAAAQQEIDDMKATSGIYDASLGAQSNEKSGIAIARRQQQSDVVNMHFIDNLERSFAESGKELAYVLPIYYDTPRTVRILGDDEAPKVVKINQKTVEGQQAKLYDVKGATGKYDVVVKMSRAYSTKRMESFDMMSEIISNNQQLLPMIGDIFFKNSDLAGSDKLAERFQKMLPPQLQDQKEGEQQPIPPEIQQKFAEMQQQHQALNAYAQDKEKEVEQYKAGAQVKQMEIESRERIEAMKADLERQKMELELAIAEINAKAQEANLRMKLEGDLTSKLRVQDDKQAHEVAMRVAEVGHETAMHDKSHEQGKETADTAHEHAMEMQQSKPEPTSSKSE